MTSTTHERDASTRPPLTTDVPALSRWQLEWACFAAIALCALLLRMPLAGIPLDRDEGGYAYIAQAWTHGGMPYDDAFERQPPGIYAMYALIQRALGTTPSAIHWGLQLYTLGTLALIFLLARRLSSSTAGLAAAAFAAFMTTAPSVLGNAATVEVFLILPLTAVILAAYHAAARQSLTWAFFTGVLAGVGVIFTLTALSTVVFSLIFVIWQVRRRWLAAPALLLGLLLVPALVAASLAVAHGSWDAVAVATRRGTFAAASARLAEQSADGVWQTLGHAVGSFWPVLLLALIQVIAECSAVVLGPGTAGAPSRQANTLWMLAWLGASAVGLVAGGASAPHGYLHLIPPLAVLAGMAVDLLDRGPLRHAIAVGLVVASIGIGVLSDAWYYLPGDAGAKSLRLYANPAFAASPAVGAFIAEHSGSQDSVFILGSEPEILVAAVRRSATRYIYVYPLTGPSPDARQRQIEALKEVQRSAPHLIVTVFLPSSFAATTGTPADIFDGTQDMINASYRLTAVLGQPSSGEPPPLVQGAEAEQAWLVSPAWYGAPTWCALAVWERVAPVDAATRAAAEAKSRAGMALDKQGDTAAAIADYREAIRLDPSLGAAHNNLAAALAKSNQVDEAIAQYEEAIRLAPLRAEPHWNLAGLLHDNGRLPEAIDQLRAALRFNPKAEMRYRLATVYAQTGNIAEAQAELEQVLREHPDSSGAQARMAWLLATGDRRRACATARVPSSSPRTPRSAPSRRDANVLNSLAAAYAEVGRYADDAAVVGGRPSRWPPHGRRRSATRSPRAWPATATASRCATVPERPRRDVRTARAARCRLGRLRRRLPVRHAPATPRSPAIPLERDEGEYAYIAQQWLQGALPYRDSFDQKPPGVARHVRADRVARRHDAGGDSLGDAAVYAGHTRRAFPSRSASRAHRPAGWPPPPSPRS